VRLKALDDSIQSIKGYDLYKMDASESMEKELEDSSHSVQKESKKKLSERRLMD